MLKFYFSSVLIWFIIIYASAKLTNPLIKKNGWLDSNIKKSKAKGIFGCLLIAIVPIFRLIVTITFFILAFNKKETLIK